VASVAVGGIAIKRVIACHADHDSRELFPVDLEKLNLICGTCWRFVPYSSTQTVQISMRSRDRRPGRNVMTDRLLIMPEPAKHIADGVMPSNRTPCVSRVKTQFTLSVCDTAIRSSLSKASIYCFTRAARSSYITRYAPQFGAGREGVRRFLLRPTRGRPTRLLPNVSATRGVRSATRIFRAAGLR